MKSQDRWEEQTQEIRIPDEILAMDTNERDYTPTQDKWQGFSDDEIRNFCQEEW